MNEVVLIVDDDDVVLDYSKSLFANKGVKIRCALSGIEALDIIKRETVAVIVSDNEMPGMNGIELLSRVRQVSPNTVKIMMTGFVNLSTTLEAINRGEVFRFVVKPWEPAEMIRAVKDGVRRYRILQSLKREDEFILYSLAQTIELKDVSTKGHCDRVASLALQIAERLGLSEEMQQEIKYGSWLHDCGKIGVPEGILNAARSLTAEEFAVVKNHPAWGLGVVVKANLSPVVQNIVQYHHERYDGKGYPNGLGRMEIPLEARIVAVADIFDALTMDRPYRSGFPQEKALELITEMRGTNLDPVLVDVLFDMLAETTLVNDRRGVESDVVGR